MLQSCRPIASLARSSIRTSRQPPSSRTIAQLVKLNAIPKPHRSFRIVEKTRPTAVITYRPFCTSLLRLQDKPFSERKFEEKVEGERLEAHPGDVSTSSSIHPITSEQGDRGEEKDEDMLREIKSDIKVIRETFALNEVPREAFLLGLAGLTPYAATAATTVYLAWDINHADLDGQGLLLSGDMATQILEYIQPLQIGYGAVIISFLGAIHWGLEWAGYGGTHGFRRYAIGVFAPAFAWPTILMPYEYALISQFVTFTALYYTDSQATVNGWVPHWYSSYRFVLTFVVGASIVLSLVGRGQIVDKLHRLPNPQDRVEKLKSIQAQEAETEERYKQEKLLKGEEEEEDDEEEEAAEDEEAADEE